MLITKKTANKQEDVLTNSFNLISQGTEIIGDIICKGDIRMDGFMRGDIQSKSKVVIGNSGAVEGVVHCQNADISGKLKGSINVGESLFLKVNAVVTGDISTQKLIIEAGAVFNGTCQMGTMPEKQPTFQKNGKTRIKDVEPEDANNKESVLA